MAVTYTVTEPDGFKHTRTSKKHAQPEYFFAVVREPHGHKHTVSYHGTEPRAQAQLADALKVLGPWSPRVNQRKHPKAKLYPVTAVVKDV